MEIILTIVILFIMLMGLLMYLFAGLSKPGEFSSPKDFLIKFLKCYLSLFDSKDDKGDL